MHWHCVYCLTSHAAACHRDMIPLSFSFLACRWLYWIEFDPPKVSRYHLDDDITQVLFSVDLTTPSGLVIDYNSNSLYWSDLSGKIEKASLDGSNRLVVYDNQLTIPFKLAIYNDFLVWIDNQGNSISFLNTQDPSVNVTVQLLPATPESKALNGILVIGSNKQLTSGWYRNAMVWLFD